MCGVVVGREVGDGGGEFIVLNHFMKRDLYTYRVLIGNSESHILCLFHVMHSMCGPVQCTYFSVEE